MTPRHAISTALARLNRLASPLAVKDIRVLFGQRKFIATLMAMLVLLAAVVVIGALDAAAQANNAPWQVRPKGRELYAVCYAIQLAMVLLLVPAFASTAIADEKQNKSYDLLRVTAMSSWQIVWGKFAALILSALILLIATLPIASISLLFGGIGAGEFAVANVALAVLAVLVVMTSLLVSSFSATSRSATAVSYLAILAGLVSVVAVGELLGWFKLAGRRVELADILGASALLDCVTGLFLPSPESALAEHGVIAWRILDLVVGVGLIATLMFLLAGMGLQPAHARRPTPMYVYALAATVILAPAAGHWLSRALGPDARTAPAVVFWTTLLAGWAWITWSCCEPPLAERVMRSRRGALRARWPGGAVPWSIWLLLGMMVVGAGLGWAGFRAGAAAGRAQRALELLSAPNAGAIAEKDARLKSLLTRVRAASDDADRWAVLIGSDRPQVRRATQQAAADGQAAATRAGSIVRLLAAMLFCYATFGWLLATGLDHAPTARTVMVFCLVALLLLPMVMWVHLGTSAAPREPTSWYHFCDLSAIPTSKACLQAAGVSDSARVDPLSLVYWSSGAARLDTASSHVHAACGLLFAVLAATMQRRRLKQLPARE